MTPQFIPFKPLRAVDVAYLVDIQHQEEKEIYIDCLSLMHDLLADFGSTEEHNRFEANWIKQRVKRLRDQFGPQGLPPAQNIGINLATALGLYDELTAPTRAVTRFVALQYVDAYQNALLEQYRTIRLHSKAPSPQSASGT